MWQQDAYRMIQRHAADAGIKTRIGNHTFRATGITTYLQNGGTLEHAQQIAAYESPAPLSCTIECRTKFRWTGSSELGFEVPRSVKTLEAQAALTKCMLISTIYY
jgi:hypothetical protein